MKFGLVILQNLFVRFNIMTIAVLLTCYNRKAKTISCLKSLFAADLPAHCNLSVFLVDDGSTDGTSDEVKKNFPKVNIIKGDGQLYWSGGMRLAWETASKAQDFDFYLWLNDDTLIDDFAINELLGCYLAAKKETLNQSIIVGACRESSDCTVFSYGGRNEDGPLIPNGKIQECKYINGNVVLISKEIFKKLGNLSSEYTHSIGDFDYGLSAIHKGIKCYTTTKYIAVCPQNISFAWSNPETPLFERIKLLYSPKGLNLKEYIIFRKKFWGWKWIIFTLKVYLKVIAPSLYNKIKNNNLT